VTDPFVDTDVLIRLLTGDNPVKQVAARALFDQVASGAITLAAPETVIADAVYVLSSGSLYRLPRAQIGAMLTALVRLPHFRVRNRRNVLDALGLYATTNLDFSDAFIVAAMRRAGSSDLYGYDGHYDRIAGITRREP
jgi:predicted nucleic acid-binding protein